MWESSKPFPPSGQRATEEHAQHFLDFAVLLRVLAPNAHDNVLDLGAGSCWVSDLLRRCGVRTVAVDLAFDMLQLGARRLGSTRGLTVGDIEQLPFTDNSFTKACSLNAFHHIPNVVNALREVRRVLTADGVAFFSEPGAGHAMHPTSVAASRNYGVLENEILIDRFMDSCVAAGFADARLHPISQIIPLFNLDRHQWTDWVRFTASQRPARALEKMWRAALEFVGSGKKTVLFEEAFAIRLLRELQPVIQQHPVITAHCSSFVKPTPAADLARLQLLKAPAEAVVGTAFVMQVRVANVGTTRWNTVRNGEPIRLGVQLLDADAQVLNRDYLRTDLPVDVAPGDQCELTVVLSAPVSPGSYILKLDVVREGVRWFELNGSKPVMHSVFITGASRD